MTESIETSEFPELSIAQQVSNYIACTVVLGNNTRYISVGMWNYGSTVYGYKTPSDADVIVVFDAAHEYCNQFSITNMNDNSVIDFTLYSKTSFLKQAHNHEISVLECIYSTKENTLVQMNWELKLKLKNFKINKPALRSSISKTASNSYVKAKKKLIVEKDFDLECSLKSLWHSLRILEFGTQLAEDGSILDFTSCNWIFKDILKTYTDTECDWLEIHKVYKPMFNEMSSVFKEVCPKSKE